MRDGWRQVTLGEVCRIQQGKRVEHLPAGEASYPVLGATGILGSWFEPTYSEPVVALGCRGTVGTVRYVEDPSWFGNNVMAVWSQNAATLDNRYLALSLEGADLMAAGAIGGQVQKQITRTSLAPVQIALPPLRVQERIVDLIDTLDTAIQKAEGQAARAYAAVGITVGALSARATQDGVTALGEHGTFLRGRRFTKADYSDEGVAGIHYGQIYTSLGPVTRAPLTRLPEKMSSRLRLADPGDVIVATTSENVEDVGKATLWAGEGKVAFHDDSYAYKHDLDPIFATYLFTTPAFHYAKRQFVAGLKVMRVSGESLSRIELPIPSRGDQERIGAVASALNATRDAAMESLQRLRALRTNLLTVLLSGEHEIPESYDEVMEVAS